MTAAPAGARDTSFFGPAEGLEIQPEADVFHHVAKGVRLLLQVQDTAMPSKGTNTLAVGGFVDWSVAPVRQRRARLADTAGDVEPVQLRIEAGLRTRVRWFRDGQIIE